MLKQYISMSLRRLGLARMSDYLHYLFKFVKNHNQNKKFKKSFPDVKLPPDFIMYESFQLNYHKYYIGGLEDAEKIVALLNPHYTMSSVRILDWGCGPARIIRHFPELLGPNNEYFGTDYNPSTIKWCSENIPGVTFELNTLSPPLPYSPDYFDVVIGLSVFTHLSEENHHTWIRELNRITKLNGLLYVTSHGNAFVNKLTNAEINAFSLGKLVIRSNVKEGYRMYGAFHPPQYLKSMFENNGFNIISHIPGKVVSKNYISQDIWIIKKVYNNTTHH